VPAVSGYLANMEKISYYAGGYGMIKKIQKKGAVV
jgi:hypothetical protein